MYFDDGARTTRGMEARLLSPQKHTHAEHMYQEKTKGKTGKREHGIVMICVLHSHTSHSLSLLSSFLFFRSLLSHL